MQAEVLKLSPCLRGTSVYSVAVVSFTVSVA